MTRCACGTKDLPDDAAVVHTAREDVWHHRLHCSTATEGALEKLRDAKQMIDDLLDWFGHDGAFEVRSRPPAPVDTGPREPPAKDMIESAWGIIANVRDWKEQSADWQEAAARWRDAYHGTAPTPWVPVPRSMGDGTGPEMEHPAAPAPPTSPGSPDESDTREYEPGLKCGTFTDAAPGVVVLKPAGPDHYKVSRRAWRERSARIATLEAQLRLSEAGAGPVFQAIREVQAHYGTEPTCNPAQRVGQIIVNALNASNGADLFTATDAWLADRIRELVPRALDAEPKEGG